jgi:hypothetical protein
MMWHKAHEYLENLGKSSIRSNEKNKKYEKETEKYFFFSFLWIELVCTVWKVLTTLYSRTTSSIKTVYLLQI